MTLIQYKRISIDPPGVKLAVMDYLPVHLQETCNELSYCFSFNSIWGYYFFKSPFPAANAYPATIR